MTNEDKQIAIKLISESNAPAVRFNVPVTDNYSNVYDILIIESNAKLLQQLHEAGFSMSMTKKGLDVTKF